MERTIIMVNSITYAYKARDFLYMHGINAHIERVPSNLRMNGCGYGVHVNKKDITAATELLSELGIKIKNILTI